MKKFVTFGAVLALLAAAAYGAMMFMGTADDAAGDVAKSPSGPQVGNTALSMEEADPASKPATPGLLYIIYDSSNSMWGELADQSRKYEAGRNALESLLASPIDRELLAFRAYGHRRPGDCRDSELLVPISDVESASTTIGAAVTGIRPTGKTPISYSLREGLKDFGDRDGDILLISDGIETCDIDPCALMEAWRSKGVKIRVHVVGVGLNDVERKAMACVADIGGGSYFDAGSEADLVEAINTVSSLPANEAEPVEESNSYALQINGTDEEGRAFIVEGTLSKDGKKVQEVSSAGRNPIAEPGDYVVRAGVLLADGSIYKPVSKSISISEPGATQLDLKITRPAIVNARFSEDGETHRGSFVTAYQKGKKVFGFRAFDEALARPGSYEFRSNPNQDNELKVSEALVEGQLKTINFDLQKTVAFTIRFRQSDGTLISRNSTLSRGGKKIYFVHSTNGGRAVPGTYSLQMDDPKTPLPQPVSVNITKAGQELVVDLPAAMLTVKYAGAPDDFLNRPDRSFVERWDPAEKKFVARTYTRIDQPVAFAPGRYKVRGHGRTGYFDPVEVALKSGEEKTITLQAKPLGKVVLRYDPNSTFKREPDRAFIYPLDDQVLIGCNCRLDEEHKVPPGRYRAKPHYAAGDFQEQTITVRAGQKTTITFTN